VVCVAGPRTHVSAVITVICDGRAAAAAAAGPAKGETAARTHSIHKISGACARVRVRRPQSSCFPFTLFATDGRGDRFARNFPNRFFKFFFVQCARVTNDQTSHYEYRNRPSGNFVVFNARFRAQRVQLARNRANVGFNAVRKTWLLR